ncbi:MAG: BRCT domain-containing protein [Sedimenticola sp.]
MAELHSNIYFKHKDPKVMSLLDSLFYESKGNEEKISSICETLSPPNGTVLSKELIGFVDEPQHDLDAESLEKNEGYSVCHFVHGSAGDDIVGKIIEFLYSLCPEIHAQAWGCGDDDPWEYWFKFEGGALKRKDDEPLMDEDDEDGEDEEIKNTIYAWWHETMPESIKEGFLNEIDLEEEYIVFTGKMENGSREEMEELAEDYGANVQKSINGKTTILVVGAKPGASKLNKAEELNVRIISESEFNNIVD